jgi:hypothetical protein
VIVRYEFDHVSDVALTRKQQLSICAESRRVALEIGADIEAQHFGT